MTASPETLTAVTPVGRALARLVERRVSTVPVVAPEGHLAGLFSGRALLALLARLLEPRGRAEAVQGLERLRDEPVASHLSLPPTCRPEATLEGACQEMVRARAHQLVVTDADRPVGMLSAIDAVRTLACLEALAPRPRAGRADLSPQDLRAGDVMTPLPDVIDADRPLGEACALILREGLSALPVVDRGGRALGVISARDLLLRLEPLLHPGASLEEPALVALGARRVRECLLRPAATCAPGETLGDACQRMVRERVHRLVIVESTRRVAGVLSAVDVVRALACMAALGRPGGQQRVG